MLLKKWPQGLVVMALLVTLGLTTIPVVHAAVDIASMIKLFGIGYVVDKLSVQWNDFVNTVTLNHDAAVDQATKVVPILSVGTGGYIGAAQVSGPQSAVQQVEAVGQIEAGYTGELFRAKIMVPLENKNPLKGIKRVQGVGVTAIFDIRLASLDSAPAPAPAPTPSPPADDKRSPSPPSDSDRRGDLSSSIYGFALFADDQLTIDSNKADVYGDVHSNGDVVLEGNKIVVHGTVQAGDRVVQRGHKVSTQSIRSNDRRIPFPRIPMDELRSRATRIYHSDIKIKGRFTVDGIVFVEGDVEVEGTVSGQGVIAATGDMKFDRGRVDSDNVAFVTADDMEINGPHARLRGLFLAGDSVKVKSPGVRIEGVMAGRRVELNGPDISVSHDTAGVRTLIRALSGRD